MALHLPAETHLLALAAAGTAAMAVLLVIGYLARLNQVLSSVPDEVAKLSPTRWTTAQVRDAYAAVMANPITPATYRRRIPPRLERRYIVTGGSGLVGSTIVLQLLARGQPPESIRIIDFRAPDRDDMRRRLASVNADADAVDRVGFVQADISSAVSTDGAFAQSWGLPRLHDLPLTVFHTAAVIVPADRSELEAGFCEAVNVAGTHHVLDAARRVGADVLVSTTSASISIRPVGLWPPPWRLFSLSSRAWPQHFWQVLDDADVGQPLRPRHDFYANYPASKATAERLVCGANGERLRTGCIRPANGVYGHPTDNTVGGPLSQAICPTWTSHIVQSFVHAVNVGLAHLDLEAILATSPAAAHLPQAGRPYVITDPNPPITYGDLYTLIGALAATPFRTVILPPVAVLLLAYAVEAYTLARLRWRVARALLPPLQGDVKHLKPAIFSICTHLVASDEPAAAPVAAGGLGYTGAITTLQGMAQEVAEWNRAHREAAAAAGKLRYQTSVALAEEIRRATQAGSAHSMVGS